MTVSNGRRLSDADLRVAILDYTNPLEIEGFTNDRPDRDFAPTILGEYHLPAGSDVRCSLCKKRQKHQNGFVVEFAPGQRHLIGGDCGKRELGADFGLAKSRHNEERSRRNYLLRLDALVAAKQSFIEYCDTILFGEALGRLIALSRELESSAGNSMGRLRSMLMAGRVLTEEVMVRDMVAEDRRDAGSSETSSARALYKTETVQLGPLRGRGVVQAETIRTRVFELKKVIRELSSDDTQDLGTRVLQRRLMRVEAAMNEAETAISMLRDASAFFEPDNLERLQRWSASFSKGELVMDGSRLRAGGRTLKPLKRIKVPALPEIRK